MQVQYTALPHYEDKYEDFVADTTVLRRRFTEDGKIHLRSHPMYQACDPGGHLCGLVIGDRGCLSRPAGVAPGDSE